MSVWKLANKAGNTLEWLCNIYNNLLQNEIEDWRLGWDRDAQISWKELYIGFETAVAWNIT